jgi:uncharacterized membrane protein YeaQ/YmgE (transglycosylase-associated protein family)
VGFTLSGAPFNLHRQRILSGGACAVRGELLIRRGGFMFQVIGTIIFGAVIGVLARIVLPGKQAYGWIVTVLLGIAGALIGYWLWGVLGGSNTFGLDWIRWVISVAGAAILSLAYSAITRKSKSEGSSA